MLLVLAGWVRDVDGAFGDEIRVLIVAIAVSICWRAL